MRFLLCVFLILSSALAQAQLGDASRSARSRAMGGVYAPFARGADAIFVNPAGLATSPVLEIKLLELSAATNSFTFESIKDFQDIDADNPDTFNKFFGEKVWAQATGKLGVAIPFFGIGYLNNAEVSLELHNPAFPEFDTYFVQDEAIYLAGAFPLSPTTYLGLAFKRINRWGGATQELSIGDVSDVSNIQDIGDKFQNKGQGYGVDVALMTELPVPVFKPTLGLIMQDVGTTTFNKTAGDEAPPAIAQSLTFAGGLGVDLPGLDVLVGFEARHLTEPDIQIGKKLHLGAEVSLPMIDLRAGYGQGYFSYGAGVNLLIFHIDAVSYTEEMGVYPGQAGDARYMVTLNIDLSFDADFKFTDNGGKKRRLKQRR